MHVGELGGARWGEITAVEGSVSGFGVACLGGEVSTFLFVYYLHGPVSSISSGVIAAPQPLLCFLIALDLLYY